MTAAIEAVEIATILRRALAGEIQVKLIGDRPWRDLFNGNVEYAFGDWHITFFNDVGELDYVERAVAPDGRIAEYDDWFADNLLGSDPLDLLELGEQKRLEALLEGIKPEAP